LALTTGPGSVASAPGIDEAIDLVLVGGAAEVVAPAFDFLNPANIGQPVQGGFFAGLISHTADGVPTHALIVAPAATGATGFDYTLTSRLAWKTAASLTSGTDSEFDGVENTAAMVTAGIASHPAAQFCVNLNIGGFADWYLPSRLELNIAYFNLKPNTTSNSTSWGINIYSVPKQTINNTAGNPPQTSITAFQSGQPEAFAARFHWSSTEINASNAKMLNFSTGAEDNPNKGSISNVRAFRRVAL
jgi:hypothetical protein